MLTINKVITILVLQLVSIQVSASIVLQGTRLVFPSDRKSISIQAVNHSEQSALTQSWVDEGNIDSTPETTNAPFIVTPPISKISANEGSQIRIQYIGDGLPKDRESVFYLNVLDISPKPKNKTNLNVLQLALQTRIKLFYRPIELTEKPENIINKVKFYSENQSLNINNPSPYFLNISELYMENNQSTPIAKSLMVAPFSIHKINYKNLSNTNIVIIYIDDRGDFITYKTMINNKQVAG